MGAALDKAHDAARKAIAKIDDVTTDKVIAHIQWVTRNNPATAPEQIIRSLGREYTLTVATIGVGTGAIAAAPAVGTAGAIGYAAFDIGTFTAASALYALSVAEIHGVRLAEPERRRMLVMAVLAGNSGVVTLEKAAGRTGAHWGKSVVAKIPAAQLRQINKVLGKNFVTKYGTKQGILVLGKVVPAGIGAAIGGAGNAAFARLTIRAARQAFGPAPARLPAHLRREEASGAAADDFNAA